MNMENDEIFSERRKFRRINVDFSVEIIAAEKDLPDELNKGQGLNISQDGICLKTLLDIPVTGLVSLSCSFAGRDSQFVGEVVWKKLDPDGYIYGLKIKRWAYLDPLLEREINPDLFPFSASRQNPEQSRKVPFPRNMLGVYSFLLTNPLRAPITSTCLPASA